jgi:hypothetical protein
MKSLMITAFALALCACNRPAGSALFGQGPHGRIGRYAGVGLYPAGSMWSQLAAAAAPKDAAAARVTDDEQVIVVIDSQTGELRQCGNLSGYCIGLNPWAKPLATTQAAPAPLLKHAAELAQEAAAAAQARTVAAPAP